MTTSIQARLLQHLESDPNRRAIAFYQSDRSFTWYTRDQFYKRALGYAKRLEELGLRRGDACVLVLPSTEFATTALTAVFLLGAVPLLVAPPLLQNKEAYSSLESILVSILERTRPRLVIGPDVLERLQPQLEAQSSITRVALEGRDFQQLPDADRTPVLPSGSDVAAMQLTSGTTGFPRICVWRQQNVLAALDGMQAAMELTAEDCCLNWTPLYHDMGLVNNFLLCMTSGVPLVMLQPHDFVRKPARWLQSLHDTGATLTWSPNFGFAISAQRIRDRELEGVRLDNVRAFWNAAERIHEETMREFSQRFAAFGLQPTALKTNFGCAENVGGATFSLPEQGYLVEYVDRERFHHDRLAVPVDPAADPEALPFVSCGRPYPGMTVQILSDSGEPLPEGHVGEVALDTPSRMEAYLLDPDATAQARQGNLLLTGDLGYVRGQEFYWVGRSRERIAVRGKKVDPSDFEAVMHNIAGLRHGSFAAFGVDDPEQGTQRVVIVAEVREPMAAPDGLEQISMDIRDQTLKHLGLNVSEILLVPANTLTKTSSGKRRHRYFRQLYEEGQLQKHSLLVPS